VLHGHSGALIETRINKIIDNLGYLLAIGALRGRLMVVDKT